MKKLQNRDYLILSLFWILSILIVNPVGEFPLNDDWAYAKDVLLSVNSGHLELVNWPAMTLVSQIVLGSFVCKLFGFSFTLLRLLTLFIGLVGVLTTYTILKEITLTRKIALFISFLVAGNPLFFSLSNTFMTDIYFYTFSVLSVFFFNRSFNSTKTGPIIIATLFIIIATLIRQIGIVIPISFALVFYFQVKPATKSRVVISWLPLLFCGTALFSYNYWLAVSHKNPESYFSMQTIVNNLGIKTFEHIFFRIGNSGMTLGLFLFPILLLFLPDFLKNILKKENRTILICTLLFTIPLIRVWIEIPFGNVFYNFGIGPQLLKDTYILHINNSPVVGEIALIVIRLIGLCGGILLYYSCFRFIFKFDRHAVNPLLVKTQRLKLFCLYISVLLFGTFVIPDFFFDRYLIQLLLPLIIVIIPFDFKIDFKRKISILAIVLTTVLLFFSVGSTHDYLSWNRARWQGLNYLMNDLKKSPHLIDGGFEFNGWYETGLVQQGKSTSWWFVDKDDYVLAFGPIEGYATLKSFPYRQSIPFEKRYIYLLHKIN